MSHIRIEQLSVCYFSNGETVEAIRKLSLELKEGGIYSIIGPSGSGKSTLLHTLGGIIKNYKGKIEMNGTRLDPAHHSIGLVPQNYGLLPWKKVKDNIILANKIRKQAVDDTFYREIINTLELDSLLNRYPGELSGGQQQRVALARAFVQQPILLLMDEPFSALDTLTAERCRKLFLDIWKRHKVTTLFVTHNLDEAVRMGKYIVLLGKSPGHIHHILENPLMQQGAVRNDEAYLEQVQNIRRLINEEWL